MQHPLDVVGIGNAIVDVIAHAGDDFLTQHGLAKGVMTLIEAERAEELYTAMGPGHECSGGSAANTIAGIAALGGHPGYIGKVRDDELGRIFSHDLRAIGVRYETPPAPANGNPTGRSFIFVSPDAQRTMQTFLGVSVELRPEDIDPDLVAAARITYLEGYLWDRPEAQEAFIRASEIAHEAGRQIALTLSDPFCVDRHRDSFRDLVHHHVDLLFANEHEIVSLYRAPSFDAAMQELRGHCPVAALTRSARGSVLLDNGDVHVIDPEPVEVVVDSTGAGDLYAAGFLFGLARGMPIAECGRIGSVCASEVISHVGARPEADLRAMVTRALGKEI